MQTVTKGSPLRGHESLGGVLPGVDRVVAAMLRRTVPRGLNKLDGAA
jgi:hypothetical protein